MIENIKFQLDEFAGRKVDRLRTVGEIIGMIFGHVLTGAAQGAGIGLGLYLFYRMAVGS